MTLPTLTLTYFDFDGGRGEECRLALHLAEVPFVDDRFSPTTWSERKADTPFGVVPVLHEEGKGLLGHSNAILQYIGRHRGIHPTDLWEAARHEAIMGTVEELRGHLTPTLREVDPERKRIIREELASGYIKQWGANMAAQVAESTSGPFVAGDKLNVVDLKLFVVMRWFISGGLDHISTTIFDEFAPLRGLYDAVEAHPSVVSWYTLRAAAK